MDFHSLSVWKVVSSSRAFCDVDGRAANLVLISLLIMDLII